MFDYQTAVRLLARELRGDQDEIAGAAELRETARLWNVDRLKVLYDVLIEREGAANGRTAGSSGS